MRFANSLRFRLTILFLLTTVTPVIIIGFAMPFYYQQVLASETQNLTESTLTALKHNVETYLDDLERLTITPYFNEDVMYALKLKAGGKYSSASPYARLITDQAINNTLPIYLKNTRKDILGTILLPYDGSVFVYATNNAVVEAVSDYPFSDQDWYKKAVTADGKVAFINAHPPDYLMSYSVPQVFSVARLIKDLDSGKPLAVIMADADTVILKNIINKIKFNVKSITAVFDDHGQLLYSDHPLSANILNQLKAGAGTIKDSEDTYTFVQTDIEKAKWKMIVLLSDSEIREKVRWIYLVGFFIAISEVVVTFFLFFILSRWLIKPFKQIIAVMKRVQEGNLSERFITHGKDEIAQLGNALNNMIEQINELIASEIKAVVSQRDAEFRALQSQIQPHFLYNTLTGLIGLNRLGNQKGVEKAILGLSGMLRYILEHGDWTSVSEEFLFLERYCDLQKLRFQERLQVEIHCDPIVKTHKIPKLLLQPIAENAVIHGVEPIARPCKISITATVGRIEEQPFLLIRIKDDGTGFDPSVNSQREGIGISNIRERLKLSYQGAFLSLTCETGKGTLVTIGIPEEGVNK